MDEYEQMHREQMPEDSLNWGYKEPSKSVVESWARQKKEREGKCSKYINFGDIDHDCDLSKGHLGACMCIILNKSILVWGEPIRKEVKNKKLREKLLKSHAKGTARKGIL